MSPRAVLFDLDGVLVESEEAWYRAALAACRAFGGRPPDRAGFAATFGQGTEADVAQFQLRCSPRELDAFYESEVPRHAAHIRVFPDALPVLQALGNRGIARALTTNTIAPLARAVVTSAGLAAQFEFMACAGMVPHPKPAPDLLTFALESLELAPEEAWMVGDSRFDREAARSAGVRFVGMRIDGDLRVERLAELLAML